MSSQILMLMPFFVCSAGCAAYSSDRVPEDPHPLMEAVGDKPSVKVVLSADANESQRSRCRETVSGHGVSDQAEADVVATVDISGHDNNTLIVTSKKKGQVLKQDRPAWSIGDLCDDALSAALRVWGRENGRKVPPPPEEAEKAAREAAARDDKPGKDSEDKDSGERRRPRRDADKPAKKAAGDPWGNL